MTELFVCALKSDAHDGAELIEGARRNKLHSQLPDLMLRSRRENGVGETYGLLHNNIERWPLVTDDQSTRGD